MPPHRSNATNANTKSANVAPPVPDQEVSNVEFKNVIQILSQIVANHNNRVQALVNANGGWATTRVSEFVRINPSEFLGSQTDEDPHNFLDEIIIFEMMHVTRNDRVELASYQRKDVLISSTLSERKIGVQMQLLLRGIGLVRPFWIGFSQ